MKMKKPIIMIIAVLAALSLDAQNLTILHLNDTHSHVDPEEKHFMEFSIYNCLKSD